MSHIRFLHISDTHFLNEFGDALQRWGVFYNPAVIFEDFLKNFKFDEIDFVIHTGDLIHDGDADDYKGLKELIEKYVPSNIPVYYVLGNHDIKDQFFEAYKVPSEFEAKYTHVEEFNGYRLIFIDTADPEAHHGVVDQETMDWLAEKLEEKTENGTLIFQHHPLEISWKKGIEETEVPDGYVELMNHPEIRAIFTGHLHMNRSLMIDKTPQFTANSFVFGMTVDGEEVWNTNRLGYHIVDITPDRLDVFNEIVYPVVEKLNQNIL